MGKLPVEVGGASREDEFMQPEFVDERRCVGGGADGDIGGVEGG